MKSSNQSICWWAVTLQDVLLTFLMYAGERTSQIILIRWYSGQSHLDINSNAVAIQMTDLDLTWLFPPSLSAKQKLIIADFFFFYHVCCRVVVRLALNLKLIKDTQQHSLLTWLFTFPSPFFFQPLHPSICPSVVPQLENTSRWNWRVLPDARWSIREGVRESKMEGGKEPKCAPAVMAQRCSLLRPVIIQRWPFPELPLENHVDFSRSLTLLAVDHNEKSPDVSLSSFPHYTLKFYSFLILRGYH